MKFFANSKIWKKIVIVMTLVLTVSFVKPEPVEAVTGGELLNPINYFVLAVGDAVMDVIHLCVTRQGATIIRVNIKTPLVERILMVLVATVAVVALIALAAAGQAAIVYALGKIGASAAIGAATFAGVVKNAGVAVAIIGTIYAVGTWMDDEVVLPLFAVTPEQIFRNDDELPLFNVNFWNPKTKTINTASFRTEVTEETAADKIENMTEVEKKEGNVAPEIENLTYTESKLDSGFEYNGDFYNYAQINSALANNLIDGINNIEDLENKYIKTIDGDETIVKNSGDGDRKYSYIDYYYISEGMPQKIYKITIYTDMQDNTNEGFKVEETKKPAYVNNDGSIDKTKYSETIENTQNSGDRMENEIPSNVSVNKTQTYKVQEGEIKSMSSVFSTFVIGTYKALMILATVGMMSVLVYIGIRILTSSVSEKAKYKQMLGDWLIGMVLLYTMHYIMYFSNSAVDQLSNFIKQFQPFLYEEDIEDTTDQKIWNAIEKKVENPEEKGIFQHTEGGKNYVIWHTDMVGTIRMKANAQNGSMSFLGYTIMYIVMVVYTVSFIFMYIKRLIYIAFLTMIAPFVALTYPLDKIKDGSAQGFNYWFREYIFNLLLQPMHLLIYTLLVSAAIEFASTNFVYSLCALGFIGNAEKIIRTMFGFKADTPGTFAGPASAALAFSGMQKLLGRGGSKGKGDAKGSIASGSDKEGNNVTSSKSVPSVQNAWQRLQQNNNNEATEETPQFSFSDGQQTLGTWNDQEDNNLSQNSDENVNMPTFVADNSGYQPDMDNSIPEEFAGREDEYEMLRDEGKNNEEIADYMGIDIGNEDDNIPIYDYSSGLTNSDYDVELTSAEESGINVQDILDSNTDRYQVDNNQIAEGPIEHSDRGQTMTARKMAYNSLRSFGGALKDEVKGDLKGIKAVASNKGKAAKRKIKDNFKNGKYARDVAGAATGIAGAMIGTALSVGTGNLDFKNTLTYGSTGAIAGNNFGKNKAREAQENRKRNKETFERAKIGEDKYKEKQARKYQKEVAEDPRTQRLLKEKLGWNDEEIKKNSRQFVEEYMDAGITKTSEMIKLEKFRKRKENYMKHANDSAKSEMSRSEVAQVARVRDMYDMKHKDGEKEKNNIQNAMIRDMKLNKDTADILQNLTRRYMDFTDN